MIENYKYGSMVTKSYKKTALGLSILLGGQNLLENRILRVVLHNKACKIIRKL